MGEHEYDEYDALAVFRDWLGRNAEALGIRFTETMKLDEYHTALRLPSGHWQVYEVDGGTQIDPDYPLLPDFVSRVDLVRFFEWTKSAIKGAQDKAFKEGRRYGEEQMRKAIRNLIGAADLVDLSRKDY